MSARWQEWKRRGAPRLLVQWLRNGVPLKWRGRGPSQREWVQAAQSEEVKKEILGLVRDGAFAREEAKIVSPTFLIPKKDGAMRLIHDLREVNRCIEPPRFSLRGARDAGEVVREANWLAVLDLKHGYQQVAMEPSARKYLGAALGEETVVSTVLPFGLNLSPYVFTRLTGWLAREVRKRFGLGVAVYIDDFLLGAKSREELEEGIQRVKEFFETLGVVISEKKEVSPAQKVEFIGFTWDARRKTIGVPKERRREYKRAVANLLRHGQTRRVWTRVIGKLGFLREAVGPTMRHIRSLLHLAARWRTRGELIEAEGEAREDLLWWKEKLEGEVELPLETRRVSASLTTDASDGGLGYLIETMEQKGANRGRQVHFERAMEAEDKEAHINRKEIEAVLRALQEHREELRGRHLVWYSDSTTALAAVRRQGTQKLSRAAWELTKEVVDLMDEENIKILPKHVPGRLNSAADALSRPEEERSRWEEVLELITHRWGPLQEDPCGATREATTLLEGMLWTEKRTLLLPRVQDIGKVVNYLSLATTGHRPEGHPSMWPRMAVLVTPVWKGARWWKRVEEMRTEFIQLGRLAKDDLRQWKARNGHWPDWTASLIPLETRCGQRQQSRSIEAPCGGSWSGRKGVVWGQEELRAQEKKPEG